MLKSVLEETGSGRRLLDACYLKLLMHSYLHGGSVKAGFSESDTNGMEPGSAVSFILLHLPRLLPLIPPMCGSRWGSLAW